MISYNAFFEIATTIMKFIMELLKLPKRIKFDIKIGLKSALLKGNSIYMSVTNIGNEELFIDKVVFVCKNKYFEIECNECLKSQEEKTFEKQYSCFQKLELSEYPSLSSPDLIFIFFRKKNNQIYMIKKEKTYKHKLIKKQKYDLYIEGKEKIIFHTYEMNTMNGKVIFDPDMIYIIQFFSQKKDGWKFYCLATIDIKGLLLACCDDSFLFKFKNVLTNQVEIDKNILNYPDKIVKFIEKLIDTNSFKIYSINYTTTLEGICRSKFLRKKTN